MLEQDSRHGRKMIKRSFSASEQFNAKITALEQQLEAKDREIAELKAKEAKKDKEIEVLKEALVDRGQENTKLQGEHEETAERLRAKASHAEVAFGCSGRGQTVTGVELIGKEVASATATVAVCCYALTNPVFAAALCQAASRGAQVRVLVDFGWLQQVSGTGNAPLDSVAAWTRMRKLLRTAGVQLGGQRGMRKRNKHKMTYEAFDSNCICIDGASLVVGSYRFAEDDQKTDHSFAIITHSEEAGQGIADFRTVFETLWEESVKQP